MKGVFSIVFNFIKRHRLLSRALSMFLSIVLVFYVIPSVIYAEVGEALDSISAANEESVIPNTENADEYKGIFYEVLDAREENAKHFHLEDGTYIAAQYPYPVHYYLDGELVDIDNSLADKSGVYATPDAKIKLAKKITGNSVLFTLHDGNTKVTLSLIGANKGTVGAVTNGSDDGIDTELGKQLNLEKLSSSVIYRDILNGTDLEYVIQSLNIKENIIVKEKRDSYSYSFELSLNGLSAVMNDDGSISLLSGDGEEKYLIPAPVVFDSAGSTAPSDAACYSLTDHRNGKYTLSVAVDSDWMNAEERVFPITIDPAIRQPTSPSTMHDTYVTADEPLTNYLTSGIVRVSTDSSILWRFNYIPYLPADAYITSATLSYKPTVSPSGSVHLLSAHRITSTWSVSAVTYQDIVDGRVTFEERPLDMLVYRGTSNATFNITDIIRGWYSGTAMRGILIKVDPGFEYAQGYFDFLSAERAMNGPAFVINYTCSGGIEGHYPTISQSTSASGIGTVNLATGSLNLIMPAVSTTDSLFSAPVSLVYNSYMAGAFYDSYMPKGYKLNFAESVEKYSYLNAMGSTRTGYRYLDADGTIHDFVAKLEGSDSVYTDDGGLSLTLTASSQNITIFDNATMCTRVFRDISVNGTKWIMTAIEDKNGNKLELDFGSSGRITGLSVVPSGGIATKHISLLYNEANKLAVIYHVGSKEGLVLRYDANEMLSGMHRAYGAADISDADWLSFAASENNDAKILESYRIIHAFNDQGYLIGAFDLLSFSGIQYAISEKRVVSVSDAAVGGQSLEITYGHSHTVITTSGSDDTLNTDDDILTYYVFDERGRAKSIYSTNTSGETLYGANVGQYDDGELSKNNIKTTTALGGSPANYVLNGAFEYNGNPMEYWTGPGVQASNSVYDNGYDKSAKFSPTASSDAFIFQCFNLSSGEYTLSFNIYAFNTAGVSLTVKVLGLSDSREIKATEVPLGELGAFSTTFELTSEDYIAILITASVVEADEFTPNLMLHIDDVMLERGPNPSAFGYVTYGSVEETGTDLAADTTLALSEVWSGNYTVESSGTSFGDSIKIEPGYGVGRSSQVVYSAPAELLERHDAEYYVNNAYKVFTLSGFAYSNSAVSSGTFKLYAKVYYYQGEEKNDVVIRHEIDYQHDIRNTWQFGAVTFDLSSDGLDEYSGTDKNFNCIRKIEVVCEYSNQPYSYAYFDNITMIEASEGTTRYEYNSRGLQVSKESIYGIEYRTYTAGGQLEWVADYSRNLTQYVYDNIGNVVYVIKYRQSLSGAYNSFASPDEIVSSYFENYPDKTPTSITAYTYDTYGLITDIQTCDYTYADMPPITTQYVYDTTVDSYIFGALIGETIGNDSAKRYFYDENNGRLLAVINPWTEKGVSYTYDDMGRMTGVTPATVSSSAAAGFTPEIGAESASYTYDWYGYLSTISTDSTTYTFSYDAFGKQTEIGVGDSELASYEYNDNNGKLKKVTYGNGFAIEYVYDDLENIKEVWYTEHEGEAPELAYSYEYTAFGAISEFRDYRLGKGEMYRYNKDNKLYTIVYFNLDGSDDVLDGIIYNYDDQSRVSNAALNFWYVHSSTVNYTRPYWINYSYDENGSYSKVNTIISPYTSEVRYFYDAYDRITGQTNKIGLQSDTTSVTYGIIYADGENCASSYVRTYTATVGSNASLTYTFTYDDSGNIIAVQVRGAKSYDISYEYDDLGQLARENNSMLGKTFVYTYDNAGNITSKKTYSYTTGSTDNLTPSSTNSYTYGNSAWGDQLTAFNGVGITYDEIGNPLTYYNGASFTWMGRQLIGATYNGKTYAYTYDADGLRSSKTVDGETTNYYYSGGLLIMEEAPDYMVLYTYDGTGRPTAMLYREASYGVNEWDIYILETNMQGDVVAVYDESGTLLIDYRYDAWGSFSAVYMNGAANTSAIYNRLTYRGYYYDSDLGLYYLQSRYYDSKTGMFISADGLISGISTNLHGRNLYSYCFNNPANSIDSTGNWPEWWNKITSWIVGNIIDPITSFFSPNTNSLSGQFVDGPFRGSGALTFGYAEGNARLQINSSLEKSNGMLGVYGKASIVNGNGKIGVGNQNLALSLKGVGDALTTGAQAGLQYKDGLGLVLKAKASVLSGRATAEFEIFGWQVEFGVSGELLSFGAEGVIGLFPDEGLVAKGNIGAGVFGGGFIIRIKPAA